MRRTHGALFLSIVSTQIHAFEAYATNPGTRAMGMAGVFIAQADDSSAIWYNPGGLARANMIKREYSVEWSGIPAATEQLKFSNDQALKFIGAYAGDLWDKSTLGTGVAYLVPLELSFDIAQRISPLSARTYGGITATYRQLSGLMAAQLRPGLAAGATLDWVWVDVRCEQSPCVNYGPAGLGMSLGTTYEVARHKDWTTTLAAVWHSRAALGYGTEATSGIGTQLENYLPDRPQSLHFGAALRIGVRNAVWNTNVSIEKRGWSKAAGIFAHANDFTRLGIAEEVLIPLSQGRSVAVRLGWAQADGGENHVRISAAGMGYSFAKHHSVDIAFENRGLKSALNSEASYASLSYSWQR